MNEAIPLFAYIAFIVMGVISVLVSLGLFMSATADTITSGPERIMAWVALGVGIQSCIAASLALTWQRTEENTRRLVTLMERSMGVKPQEQAMELRAHGVPSNPEAMDLHCPSCGLDQGATLGTAEWKCIRCGTPILKGGKLLQQQAQ